jgi:hypothetical protein
MKEAKTSYFRSSETANAVYHTSDGITLQFEWPLYEYIQF